MAKENAVQRLIREVRESNPGMRYQDIANRSGRLPDGRRRGDGTDTVLIRSVVQNWATQEVWDRSPSQEAMDGLARGLGVAPGVVRRAFGEALGLCEPGPAPSWYSAAHALAERIDALPGGVKGRVLWAVERLVDGAENAARPEADAGASAVEIFEAIKNMPEGERRRVADMLAENGSLSAPGGA